jgi:hypothetical protein
MLPAIASTRTKRTSRSQFTEYGLKSNGKTCQIRVSTARLTPVVTISPRDFNHGGSCAR